MNYLRELKGHFVAPYWFDYGAVERLLIPENYCSKSKLVAGDELMLYVTESGQFIYKQIWRVETKRIVCRIIDDSLDDNLLARDKVSGRNYNVLAASLLYLKLRPGDEVVGFIPAWGDTDWLTVADKLPPAN